MITRIAIARGKITNLGPLAGGILGNGNVCVWDGSGARILQLEKEELQKLHVGQSVRIELVPEGAEEGGSK